MILRCTSINTSSPSTFDSLLHSSRFPPILKLPCLMLFLSTNYHALVFGDSLRAFQHIRTRDKTPATTRNPSRWALQSRRCFPLVKKSHLVYRGLIIAIPASIGSRGSTSPGTVPFRFLYFPVELRCMVYAKLFFFGRCISGVWRANLPEASVTTIRRNSRSPI